MHFVRVIEESLFKIYYLSNKELYFVYNKRISSLVLFVFVKSYERIEERLQTPKSKTMLKMAQNFTTYNVNCLIYMKA